MRYSILSVVAFAASSLAAGITDADVPASCKSVCLPLVQLSGTCSTSTGSSLSQAESDCICKNTSFDVQQIGSLCATCITQTSGGGSDLSAVSSACSFTNGPYNQATASSLAAKVTVTATKPGSNQVVTSTPTATSAAGTGTVASTSSKAAAPTGGAQLGKAGLVGTALEVAAALMLLV